MGRVNPESLGETTHLRDRPVGKEPRGAAALVCAVILNYLSTVVSLQWRLSLLRMLHRIGLVFSFENVKLQWSSFSLCEIAQLSQFHIPGTAHLCQQWSCSLHAVALQNIKGRKRRCLSVFRTVFELGQNPFPPRLIYNCLCYFILKKEEIKSAG